MKTKIWISRNLTESSPLKELAGASVVVDGQSLLTFAHIKIEGIPTDATWLFFYSRKGIECLLEQCIPSQLVKYKIGTIGRSTADYWMERIGAPPDFIGDGRPKETSKCFANALKPMDKVAFLRAKHSRKSVQKILDPRQVIDIPIYKNEINPEIVLSRVDIALLTSPLNAEAFLKLYGPSNEVTFVAIGQSTYAYLLGVCGDPIYLADTPSESGMLDTVKKLLEDNIHSKKT